MSEQWNGSPVELRSEPADNIPAANNAIPERLRSFPHWIVWRYVERHGKRTKVPFSPRTEQLANPSNVDDCGTYEVCQYLVDEGRFDGIGFVFSDHSPFSGIDLDSPFVRADGTQIVEGDPEFAEACEVRASHWRIIEEFESYTEWSPSENGAHIIVEGKLANARKAGKIEVYSRDRFFTITGDQRDLQDWPIAERQAALDAFASRLGPGMSSLRSVYDREQTLSDDEVITRCRSDLFDRLGSGQDDTGYRSGSEADQAFGNLIGQNTDNLEQCVRVFMASPRYQHVRTKLHSRFDLVQRACRRSFDQKSPPIDFDALRGTVSGLLKRRDGQQLENPYAHLLQEYPPGLLGEIAQFVFDRAPRPVFEMAIVAAIGLMSGVCGRAFNVGSLGLAQYLVLLAPSATGKEAIASGISAIMSAVQKTVPASAEFIGPSKTASAPALNRYMQSNPSFISIFGEFGLTLQTLTDPRANQNLGELRSLLTDLYGKNGANQYLAPTIYSDDNRNIKSVKSPAVSLIGESVPEIFDDACSERNISTGFLPRFLVIEYAGHRVPANKRPRNFPSEILIDRFATLCAEALTLNQHVSNGSVPREVVVANDAQVLLDNFDVWIDEQINGISNDALRAMWGRALVKTIKLAGVRAVGINWTSPTITPQDVEWAIAFVLNDANRILRRFNAGEVSTGVVNEDRHKAVVSVVERYLRFDAKRLKTYNIDARLHAAHVIPLRYLHTALCAMSAFKIVGSKAVNDTLAECEKMDMLRSVPTVDVERINGSRGKCFIAGPALRN